VLFYIIAQYPRHFKITSPSADVGLRAEAQPFASRSQIAACAATPRSDMGQL